ncbi:hypothetical protein [Nostoc sp.]
MARQMASAWSQGKYKTQEEVTAFIKSLPTLVRRWGQVESPSSYHRLRLPHQGELHRRGEDCGD